MACSDGQDPPGTGWDYALMGVVVAASLPFVGANLVVLAHRRRRYFQAQGGALLILASSIAGLIWIASSFVVNLQFPRTNPFLLHCSLWTFWLYFALGFLLWLVCLILRLFRLYRLCTTTTTACPSETWTLLCTLFLWIPSIIFALIATLKGASTPDGLGGKCANCHVNLVWGWYTFCTLPLFYFIILVILLFRSKGTKDYMLATEYSHTSEYSLMAFVIYLLIGVAVITKSQLKITGRCFLTFCVCFLVFSHFWVRMGWPVYLCLFKGESMDSFEEELRCYGAECFDKLGSASGFSPSTGRYSYSTHDGDWILRAIDAAMNKALECKERINQLEQKKNVLSARIKQLEKSTSPLFPSSPACAKAMESTMLGILACDVRGIEDARAPFGRVCAHLFGPKVVVLWVLQVVPRGNYDLRGQL